MSGPRTSVIVVGAGAAGLYTALRVARLEVPVILISATPLPGASSFWAQGGLAAALSEEDTVMAYPPGKQTVDAKPSGCSSRNSWRTPR
ncbi:MAG: FAD-dependent oxidoreductase, partial [Solirubrobacteraceae bacterium]